MENNQDTTFEDEYGTEKPQHTGETLRRLWSSISGQHRRLLTVLLSVVCHTIFSIAAPYYSAGIINRLFENIKLAGELGTAFRITWQQGGREIVILLFLYLGTWVFYTLQTFLMAGFAELLSLRLRTQISEKLNRLPLSYFDKHKTGAILSYSTNDPDKMSEALQAGLLRLFSSVGLIIGSLIMMLRLQGMLTLIFLVFIGISMSVTRLFSGKTLRYAMDRQQRMGAMTGLIEEYYSGRIIVRAFNQEERSAAAVHAATEELAESARKADFMINAINPAIRMVNRLGQVCIAVFAGKLLLEGSLSVGAFQAFFQYINQASEPLTDASFMVNSMQSALASVERIYQFLDEEEVAVQKQPVLTVAQAKGTVEFRGVRFGYNPEHLLMNQISFSAKAGQKIAIVGSTGAGKTTLINLLMRFYEVNGGAIFLDGCDISQMSRSDLRSKFGMVLQDTWLFGGTIAENIAYGKPDATQEEIVAAAKAARVDFFVRTMPGGYETVLSNDTETISAGQRQLLTIARVVLCNPAVLILDEATSSVDTRTEIEIGRAMKALMQGRTSFVIAHRLSTIVDADLILMMEDGDIVEQGSHRELLAAGGAYAALYNSQFA